MTKQTTLTNPLKFSTKHGFISYLRSHDSSYIASEIDYIEELKDEYFLLYLEYESKLVSEIILPLSNRFEKDKKNCSKEELRKIVDKTIKLGFELQAVLKQKADEVKITHLIDVQDNLEKSQLLCKASRSYKSLYNESSDFSKSPYNCVDQLLRRLINVPVMYYHNLFKINKTGDKTIDTYLETIEKQIVPDILVGINKDGECWETAYSIYCSTFLETIKLINRYYYSPAETDDTKLYLDILKDLENEDYISASKIQEKYSIGYSKAGRILYFLTLLGFVSNSQNKLGYKVNKQKVKGV